MQVIGLSETLELSNANESDLVVGATVTFGVYEQDQNINNGPESIEWRVVAILKGNVLLLSQYILDYLPYNETKTDITWENSTIRQWLNESFYQEAFTSEEKEIISTCKLDNSEKSCNPEWANVIGGEKTSDEVFLLSYKQVASYFDKFNASIAAPTRYAAKSEATDACTWWLRSPGRAQNEGCYISVDGKPDTSKIQEKQGVRPAICVSLSKLKKAPKAANKPVPTEYDASALQGFHGLEYGKGSKGDAVKYIQQMLIDQTYLSDGKADGAYGAKSEQAVRSFQENNGLPPTGIADLSTQYMLAEMETGFSRAEGEEYEFAGLDRYGVYKFEGGIYIGLLRNDGSYQEGTQIYDNGTIYVGPFKNNMRDGKGQAWYLNGDYYNGNWKNDLMNGKGVYHFGSEGSTEQYDGEWVDGTMTGKGTYTLPNGKKIKGIWENNQQIGWWK